MELAAIAVGGFFGAIVRYSISLFLIRFTKRIPFGTLVVNIFGSFGFGVVMSLEEYIAIHLYQLLAFGFFGAFTTFSTFSVEAVQLWQQKELQAFRLYVFFTIVGSFVAFTSGLYLFK